MGCIFMYILDFSNVTYIFKIGPQKKIKNVTEWGNMEENTRLKKILRN